MRTSSRDGRRNSGQAMIEFLLVIMLFLVTLFGAFEICRLLLSYTTLANASRVGIRYATVGGSSNDSSTSTDCDAIYVATTACVTSIVRDFTAGSLINSSQVTVAATGLGGAPGTLVRLQVSYPYQPFILLPMSTTLATQSEGVITF